MSDQALVIVVLAGVAVVIAVAVALWRSRRRRRLREWFGSDYDRAVESAGSRHAGEAELLAREKRTVSEPDQPILGGQRDLKRAKMSETPSDYRRPN